MGDQEGLWVARKGSCLVSLNTNTFVWDFLGVRITCTASVLCLANLLRYQELNPDQRERVNGVRRWCTKRTIPGVV